MILYDYSWITPLPLNTFQVIDNIKTYYVIRPPSPPPPQKKKKVFWPDPNIS